MKKLSLLILAASCCFPVFAQQTEGIEISATARADVSPSFPGGGVGFDNSALYTFIDGEFGQHFSYSVSNHWLSTDPASLYRNSLRSDDVNWLDWAYLCCELGNWSLELGKDMLDIGGTEMLPNDVDNHPEMSSSHWNFFPVYQWGAKLSYAPGDSEFTAGFASSPFSEHPFQDALFSYSLKWDGEYGPYTPYWTADIVERGDGLKPMYAITLGNVFNIGNLSLGLDGMVRGLTGGSLFKQKGYLLGEVSYNFSDAFEAKLRGGLEYNCDDVPVEEDEPGYDFTYLPQGRSGFCSGYFHWYPLRDSRSLRVHAVGAYSWIYDMWTLSFGVTYNLDIIGLFK